MTATLILMQVDHDALVVNMIEFALVKPFVHPRSTSN
jgi:hypothetical protein